MTRRSDPSADVADCDLLELVIVVVTWNSAEHVAALLHSLPDAVAGVDSWGLFVADNGSTDGTCDLVRRLAPQATVVPVGRNAGFAAGINAATAAARPSRAVLLLNPDVRLRPGSVRQLLDTLALPSTGIAVPRLVDADGELAPSLRREPTLLRIVGEALLGGDRAGRFHRLGEVVTDHRRYDRPTTADWATGAVMLVSRACLEALGGFDESFFLYSEETDFALRARDAGFRLRYAPDAVAVHEGGESNTSPRLYALLTANRVRLYGRRHGRLATTAFWAALLIGEAARAVAGRATSRAAVKALLRPTAVLQPA